MDPLDSVEYAVKSVMSERVGKAFDDLSAHYDDLYDLWFSYFFSRLHYIVAKEVIIPIAPKKVLDIGCGTGFQSFLHAQTGSEVMGIDISADLLAIARTKTKLFDPTEKSLFGSSRSYKAEYDQKIHSLLSKKCPNYGIYSPPEFRLGDACELLFPNESFDHINCAGTVLSFIPNYQKVLSEIYRVLKPGGTALIEMESKWTSEMLWYIPDWLLHNKFRSSIPFQLFKSYLKHPFASAQVPSSYKDEHGKTIHLTQFTRLGLTKELNALGFHVRKVRSIHSAPNLIPSSILCDINQPRWIVRLFKLLMKIEEKIPNTLVAANLVFIIQKPLKSLKTSK